jgi:N-acetylmuramoyl-L-alanine amidase
VADKTKGAGEVWDAGHGGADPGAVDGIQPAEGDTIASEEEDITLAVVRALKELRPGIALTREGDRDVGLSERAQMANRMKARLLVSVHCNATGNTAARGIETFYHAKSPKGMQLATCLYEELAREFRELPLRGIKSDLTRYRTGFAVLRETICPSALIELGFLTNPEDERVLASPQAASRVAWALDRGVERYLRGGEAA